MSGSPRSGRSPRKCPAREASWRTPERGDPAITDRGARDGRSPPSQPIPCAQRMMTLRMTSPASIARNASLTWSSLIVRDTMCVRVEPAGLDQIDEALEVAPHLRRAVLAAEDLLLLVEELEGGKRHLRVQRGSCRRCTRAAVARHVVGLDDRLGEADDLERVVDAAAAGQALHLLDGIALRRIDDVGGAELLAPARASSRPCRPR